MGPGTGPISFHPQSVPTIRDHHQAWDGEEQDLGRPAKENHPHGDAGQQAEAEEQAGEVKTDECPMPGGLA